MKVKETFTVERFERARAGMRPLRHRGRLLSPHISSPPKSHSANERERERERERESLSNFSFPPPTPPGKITLTKGRSMTNDRQNPPGRLGASDTSFEPAVLSSLTSHRFSWLPLNPVAYHGDVVAVCDCGWHQSCTNGLIAAGAYARHVETADNHDE